MTMEHVTPEEMAQALNKMGVGLMKMLGITPTAEMGQTPWLPTSNDAEIAPVVDLDQMAELVHTMAHNQEELSAVMAQAGHPYGLCDKSDCPPCRDQRRTFATKLAPQVEKAALAQAGTEIDEACTWAGASQLRDQLSDILAAYREAGSPGMQQADFNVVIEGVN